GSGSPGSCIASSAVYFGSNCVQKYRPRSCIQPLKSSCVILFGVFSNGSFGLRNFTGEFSSVMRGSRRGVGAALSFAGGGGGEMSAGYGAGCNLSHTKSRLYCTTSVPPFEA